MISLARRALAATVALAAAVALSVGAGGAAAATPPGPDGPWVEPGLVDKLSAGGHVRLNVVTKDRADLPDAAAGQVLQTFTELPVITLRGDRTTLETLTRLPGVLSISEDAPVPPTLDRSIPLIGANRTRAAGFTGAGTAVAILDTGVATRHPFLGGRVVAEACFSPIDATYSATSLCPNGTAQQEGPGSADSEKGPCAQADLDCAHGTHVAGIAAGTGGVAPAAKIVAIQVFSKFDSDSYCGAGGSPCILSFTSAQLAGLEKVHRLRQAGTPVVAANLSLGGGRYTGPCDSDSRKPAIDTLRAAGVATVIAAGNSGYSDAVSAPSCVSSAIAVGSTTDADEVSTFSNRGPLLDVFAPGTDIISSIPGSGQGSMSGTSMAAPHVTGAYAVLRHALPQTAIGELETKIESTGRRISTGNTATPRLQLDVAAGLKAPPGSLADFDLDGKADVLARDATGDLYLYPGTGAPGFKPRYRVGSGFNASNALVTADLTLDGKADLITRKTSTGELLLFAHTGDPTAPFTGTGTVVGTGFDASNGLLAGDFTLDGRADLISRKASTGELLLFAHAGDPTAPFRGTGTGIVVGTGFDAGNALLPGDLTLDGKADLLTRKTSTGELLLFAHTGNPTAPFTGTGTVVGTGFNASNAFLSGDFTNDHKIDLITRKTSTGELLLFAHTGNPAAPFTGTGTVVGTGWNGMFLG
ncbi:S8 family serine peptidase [Spongiactinospora rosea]|uniref:S8 family serine peptidase n=1 Tax=Spongiactinospora rosea TaxID=2248750 RepID=UPI0018F47652|nr:S8 family serine peptidase [Spongiactinospora rosea]